MSLDDRKTLLTEQVHAVASKEEAAHWTPLRPGLDHNVLVVGGGQNGSAFAFALSRAGIGHVSVIDAAPREDQIGVWLTRARMNRLRTPKGLVGPELGFAALSFQSWFENRYGVEAYAEFDRIARTDWAEYLAWFRTATGVHIRLDTRLVRIEPIDDHFRVHLEVNGKAVIEHTRKIILANGVGGSGGPFIPPLLAELPPAHFAHTGDSIDPGSFAGKDIAVVGAAASAFDAAAVALEAGARSVHMFVRRERIAATTAFRSYQYQGPLEHYTYLPDRIRWQHALRGRAFGTSPPAESIDRVVRHHNFHLHLGSRWDSVHLKEGRVVALMGKERFEFDFVIAGTGYAVDLRRRPELSAIVDEIALWNDRYHPPAEEQDSTLGAYPYLGKSLELQEKTPGKAPWLRHIFIYNPGAQLSAGLPAGDVLTMQRSIPKIVTQIGRDLFLDDLDLHEPRMRSAVPPDFGIDRYVAALWHGTAASSASTAPDESAVALPPLPRPNVRPTESKSSRGDTGPTVARLKGGAQSINDFPEEV